MIVQVKVEECCESKWILTCCRSFGLGITALIAKGPPVPLPKELRRRYYTHLPRFLCPEFSSRRLKIPIPSIS
ncbi:hypothetical protein evm_006620 [Chilo suppressalis]|nr:hypothetical protein evm_006620 [Chilo suppressalis]